MGLNRLIQIILVETLGLTLQSNGSDKICMKGLFRTILILRQQRPAQQEKIPSPARIYWFRQTMFVKHPNSPHIISHLKPHTWLTF